MAVAMGSGAQVTKGVADVVLLKDQFSRLPEAVGEGRRIARNIHRLGRLYLTKTVYAATLILLVAVPGFAFPFLPRHLTLAAFLTIGIPSFVLALAPSDGPLYRGRLLRALAAFAVPAGLATALGSILSFFLVDTVVGGSLEAGRTAATTTLIVLGLAFVLLLERGPGREHIAIQSYMLAMVAGLGALFAADPRDRARCANSSKWSCSTRPQWFLALLSAAIGLTIASVLWKLPQIERLESPSERRARDAGRARSVATSEPMPGLRTLVIASGPSRGDFRLWAMWRRRSPCLACTHGDDLETGPPLPRRRRVPARRGSLRRGVRRDRGSAPSLRGAARRARAAGPGGAARARPVRTPPRSGSTSAPGRPIAVDPVPRLIDGRRVGARSRPGLLQRARALNAFLARRLRRPADLRRRRRAAAPARDLRGLRAARCAACSTPRCRRRRSPASTWSATRTASCWCWRTTCGCPRAPAYAMAVREVVAPELEAPTATAAAGRLRRRRSARRSAPPPPAGRDEPVAAILSDGPEQRRLVRAPAARPRTAGSRSSTPDAARDRARSALRPPRRATAQQLDVLYRRLDEDRLSEPDGAPDRARRAAAAGAARRAGCAASTPSAPASPTTSSPTPTSRR